MVTETFSELFLESKSKDYQSIAKEFDKIYSVEYTQDGGKYVVIVSGENNNKDKIEAYEYKHAKVAKEVAKKLGYLKVNESENPFDVKKGALHRWCNIPEDEKITCECIKKALAAGGRPAKMANWAKNFGGVKCK